MAEGESRGDPTFIEEAREEIIELNNSLLDLESDPSDETVWDQIFRTARTLKEDFDAKGIEEATNLTQALEDLLDEIRQNKMEVTPAVMDVIFAAVDNIEAIINDIEEADTNIRDTSDAVARIRAILKNSAAASNIETIAKSDVTEYTERRIFDEEVGTLRGLIKRKEALSHETRYGILYLLYETGVQGRKSLAEATGKDEEGLEYHLKDLVRANLIAKVPVPDGLDGRLTFYRITPLGQHEIESDLRLIHDHNEAIQRFRCNKAVGDAKEFYAASGALRSESPAPEALSAHRKQLRERTAQVISIE